MILHYYSKVNNSTTVSPVLQCGSAAGSVVYISSRLQAKPWASLGPVILSQWSESSDTVPVLCGPGLNVARTIAILTLDELGAPDLLKDLGVCAVTSVNTWTRGNVHLHTLGAATKLYAARCRQTWHQPPLFVQKIANYLSAELVSLSWTRSST